MNVLEATRGVKPLEAAVTQVIGLGVSDHGSTTRASHPAVLVRRSSVSFSSGLAFETSSVCGTPLGQELEVDHP